MGSRGRSIQLRIYFLVAIPLITMLGLFGYVAYTSYTNWRNLDRAPNLIRATAVPLTQFVSTLQAERRAAVVYLAQPTTANLTAFQDAVQASKDGLQKFEVVAAAPGTTKYATTSETVALEKMIADVNGMTQLRGGVATKQVRPIEAFAAYTQVILDQDTVFQAEANSMTDASASSAGLGLISSVNAREDVSEQDALLAGALASGTLDGPSRVAFSQAAGRQQDDTALTQALLTPAELAVYNKTMNAKVPAAMQQGLTSIQEAVTSGTSLKALQALGVATPLGWQELTTTWSKGNFAAGTDASNAVLAVDQTLSDNAKKRVVETGGVGAIGLILTLIVTILLGRSIISRLTRLRRSAQTLAEEQLPSVVARLRRGEPVDVGAEAPPLRVGRDEIGQVGQAIGAVRQTAIRSAVEEAKVRQGVNDMFRNLARRNQSLLQRQLTVLDGMERKATDPDVLEDLFKMDHLTTRMRRHAEGLIILSGAAPGRAWSAPVKLIDVMRGAVAEVEDYARVTVNTQAKAALAGSAVTDVIHLLAELIENATTLSPPFTQVRVGGENVGNGFAIEIEDRGLGMTPQRLAELNERLSSPPEINPANTEQLGLFVVGQLARRHGISVVLRPSPYGGTTAVALIPRGLIVDDGPAAITSGGMPVVTGYGNGYGDSAGYGDTGYANTGGWGAGAGAGAGYGNGSGYGNGYGNGAGQSAGGRAATTGSVTIPPTPAFGNRGWDAVDASAPNLDQVPLSGSAGSSGWSGSSGSASGWGVNHDSSPNRGYGDADNDAPATIRISGALRQPGGTPGQGGVSGGVTGGGSDLPTRRGGRHGSGDVPVVTGVPVGRPAQPPATPFDVFTPLNRPEQGPSDAPYAPSYPDFGGTDQASSGQNSPGYGSPGYGGTGSASTGFGGTAFASTGATGSYGTPYGAADTGNNDGSADRYQTGNSAGGDAATDFNGLPRRVRQANLAPQLRASAAAAAASSPGSTGVPQASTESLAVMRNTLSAMQRGWQQGRSETQGQTEGNVDGD
jgi:signal transduction histidine kinase